MLALAALAPAVSEEPPVTTCRRLLSAVALLLRPRPGSRQRSVWVQRELGARARGSLTRSVNKGPVPEPQLQVRRERAGQTPGRGPAYSAHYQLRGLEESSRLLLLRVGWKAPS